jgi:CDGSH-type Zn-finger protein
MKNETTKKTDVSDKMNSLVRQVRRANIYAMTEEMMVKFERSAICFKCGDDNVKPITHGRTGDGYNVSFA